MSIRKKITYFASVLLALALAVCATLFLHASPAQAEGESESVVALSPIHTESADITYCWFNNPSSVYADGEIRIVTGKSGTYFVSGKTDTDEQRVIYREIVADKLYRVTAHEDNTEYLISLYGGKLGVYAGDNAPSELSFPALTGDVIDFAVDGDKLYILTETHVAVAPVLSTGIDCENAVAAQMTSDRHSEVTASRIAAVNGNIYVSLDAVFGRLHDVCVTTEAAVRAGAAALTTALPQSNDILSMSASSQNGLLYVLTRNKVTAYSPVAGSGLSIQFETDGSDLSDIYAYDDGVFALDTLNGLRKLSVTLTSQTVIAASASDATGFFNTPSGMTIKNSDLYIADTLNGRIARFGPNGMSYIDRTFHNPVSVATDNAGTLYVAYDGNRIGVFRTEAYSINDEITLMGSQLGKIKQIATDTDKTLFILSDTGLWRSKNAEQPVRISETAYKSIALGLGKNKLYAMTDSTITCVDKSDGSELSPAYPVSEGAISFAVDLNETAFVLYRDKTVRIARDGTTAELALTLDGEAYALGDKTGQILLGFMENKLLYADQNGDGADETRDYVVILDSYRHRLLKADGLSVGARFVDYSYVSPDIIGDSTALPPQSGIIYKALYDTPLYSYPIATETEYTVAANSNVIVPDYSVVAPDYDPSETPEFALVLVDDARGNRLVQGYVFKDALSEPVKYASPPNAVCTVTGELGTVVYRWPSRNAKVIPGYAEVAKNTKFEMLDFVPSFCDGYGYYWYRIRLADSTREGYVTAVSVSTIDYQQTNILPEYNAEIIAYHDKQFAVGYARDAEGNYTELADISLAVGTQIEVVGTYDSSERYTQIKYLDAVAHRTVTCYVLTGHVRYSGVNIVLLVALIIIAITVILLIIIVAKIYGAKKKGLATKSDKDETDTD